MNIVHAKNPFNVYERDLFYSPDDITINEFLDKNKIKFDRPTVCIVDGYDGLLRSEWDNRKTSDFQSIVFITLPEGGGGGGSNPLRLVALMAVVAFAPYAAGVLVPGGAAAAAGSMTSIAFGMAKAAIMIGGMALINALIPPPKIPSPNQQNYQSASPIYSLQAQGNSARLGSSIPKIYGRHPIYPDFAAQPYTEYNGNDQYLYQLFCIGLGEYNITNIRIEDTPIDNFSEITYEIINPGESVTLFPTNVETSIEVSGQELLQNQYIGGFIANASGTLTNSIGIDIVCPKGLFYANDDGGLDSRSVSFSIEYATVDDTGALTSAYAVLGNGTISAATVTPIRRSYRYSVPLGRYIIRATRTNAKSNDSRVGNDVVWSGMRAYIPGEQNYGDVTLLATRMKATNNLSQSSSRKVNLTAESLLYEWDSTNGWSATKVASSKPAWILADMCKSSYGGGMNDGQFSLIDLENLQNTINDRNVAFANKDEFNGVFDNRMTFWEAMQLVCKSVRAMPIIQGGVIHFIRDQQQSIATAMFSMRNIVKGSFSSTYILPGDETADSVSVEYFDRDKMKPEEVLCELNVGQSTNTAKIKMFGVVTRDQAYREGMYLAAANKYRRILTTFETELEGYIPTIGDLVVVSHDMPDWGQCGEIRYVEDYTVNDFRLHLSEEVIEGSGQHYIVLRRKDGTPTNAITCTVDSLDKSLVTILKSDVDFTINDTDDYERTHYAFGIATEFYRRCRIVPPIKPKGGNKVEINVVNEDDAVHIADTGIVPSLDEPFDLPPPIVKPVIVTLNITTGGSPSNPQLALSWTPASEADHYIIEWGINGLEWTRAGETTTNNYILNVTPDLIHVRVAAVGLVQGDWISQTIDARLLPTPGQVQGLALADPFTGTQAKIKWDGAARAHSYLVEVWSGAVKRKTVTTNMLSFTYTSEDATADGGPWRNLVFNVYGVNDSGQSIDVASLAVNNPAPPEMTGITVYAGYQSLMITYDPVADTDFAGVRVCMSTTSGFTPGDTNVVYEGNETVIVLPNLPEDITQYLRLAAYDDFGKDVLNYTATEYSAQPSSTALVPADVLTKLNEAIAAPGDNLVLAADRFAVKLNGSDTYPLIIANVDGTDYVGIAADVVIQGTLSASQITTGTLNAGTSISVGDGAMVLDGNGSLTIYNGDNTVPNRDFAFLSGGELTFQRYFNGAYSEYKSVKKVEYGTADSGTVVTLPGYWKTQPKIIVSPNSLESYDASNNSQSQTWQIFAQNLREDPAASGIYKFDAIAELILSANAGTDNINQSITQSADTWASAIYQLPANTSEITVNVSAKSKRGTGLDGITYYYRQVSWRVYYHDTVANTWSQSTWRTIALGAAIDTTVADSVTLTLPANITEYYIEYSAADVDGSTFSSGSQQYDYLTDTTANVSVSMYTDHYNKTYATLPSFTPTIGYEIYSIDYIWDFNYYHALPPNGFQYWAKTTGRTITLSQINNCAGLTIHEKHSLSTNVYDTNYIFGQIYVSTWPYACTDNNGDFSGKVILGNCRAVINTRKSISNSATADNTFNLLSTSWTLSGTSAITTGSINYMAVEA